MRRRRLLQLSAGAAAGLVTGAAGTRAAAITMSIAGPGRDSGLPWNSGVCRGSEVADFEAWRGRRIDSVTFWGKGDSWEDLAGGGDDEGFSGYFGKKGVSRLFAAGRPLVLSWPLIPKEADARRNPSIWAELARGAQDQTYERFARKLGRLLAKEGHAGCVVRVNWEGNGAFYPHSVLDQIDDYHATHRRAVDLMRRHVPGIRIDWSNVKKGKSKLGNHKIYPGDDWVDIVGIDYYDRFPSNPDDEVWDKNSRKRWQGGPQGLSTWLEFAQSVGKPLSLPEWGVMMDQGKHYGSGGDNPVHIRKVHQFLDNNRDAIAYECLFDMSDSKLSGSDTPAPRSAELYHELWGSAA